MPPAEPSEFFAGLLTALNDRAQALREGAADCDDEQLCDEIEHDYQIELTDFETYVSENDWTEPTGR